MKAAPVCIGLCATLGAVTALRAAPASQPLDRDQWLCVGKQRSL